MASQCFDHQVRTAQVLQRDRDSLMVAFDLSLHARRVFTAATRSVAYSGLVVDVADCLPVVLGSAVS